MSRMLEELHNDVDDLRDRDAQARALARKATSEASTRLVAGGLAIALLGVLAQVVVAVVWG